MKGPGVVACLCWLLASVGQSVQTLQEAASQTLTFDVQSDIVAQIPDLSSGQVSGFSLKYVLRTDVVSRNKVLCKIEKVRSAKVNEEQSGSYAEGIEFQHTPDPVYERELSKPFAIHFDDHQITKIVTQKTDPEWSVNIKKSLAEKFQLDLKRQSPPASSSRPNQVPRIDPSYPWYSVYEEGIGGDCETRYSILSVPSLDHPHQSQDVLNVTKVKNYRNCRSRPIFEIENFLKQGSPAVCEPQYNPPTKRQPGVWRESSSVYESGCHFGFEPDFHPVKSYSIVWYNISRASHSPVIEGILAEGKTSYYLNGRELLVVAQQNITLLKQYAIRSPIPEVANPVAHTTLEYQLPEEDYLDTEESRLFALYGPVHVPDLLETVNRQVDAVVSDMIPDEPETSEDVGPKILQLAKAFTVLKKPELEIIFKDVESDNDQKLDRKEDMKRKVVLDIMAIAATDTIALFAKELFIAQRIKPWEAVELFEGIGKNIDEPSPKVIEAYIQLLERPRIQQSRRVLSAVAITLGKMIRESCADEEDPKPPQLQKEAHQPQPRHPRSVKPYSSEESDEVPSKKHPRQPQPKRQQQVDEDDCTPEQCQSYMKVIVQKLREAKTIGRMLVYIESLVHMKTPDVLPYLKPYITGDAPNLQPIDDEDVDFLQTAVLYSLHHLAVSCPDELLPIASGIYFDQSEDYETRIAAFTVLMKLQPPLNLLERLMTELHSENSNQVQSFVYTWCSEYANSSMPYERKLAQKLQLVLPHAPESDLGLQYSQTNIYSYYDDDDDYGLKVTSGYTASNVSQIPRAFYHSVNYITGPFRENLWKVAGSLKGVDEMIEKLFQPGGIATQIVSSLGSNVQVRNVPELLDVVKARLLFKDQDIDIPKAFLYYRLFGRTSFLHLDEEYVADALEQAIEFVRKIDYSSGYSYNYAKIWMPASFMRVLPSTVGLPVLVSHRRPIILTLFIGNTRFATNHKKEAPMTAAGALTTDIQASVHHYSAAMVTLFDPAHDQVHGAALESKTEAAIAATIEVAVDFAKDTYAVSIKPKLPHKIFFHDTRPLTYIAEAAIIGEPKEEWLEQVNEIETIPEPFKYDKRHEAHPLGLSLRVVGDSESPWVDLPLLFSDTAEDEGILPALLELAVNPEMTNREFHVYLEPHHKSPASELVVTFDYDKHLKLGLPKSSKESDEENEDSSSEEDYDKALSSIYGRSYAIPDAEDTIEKLVQKTQATWAPVLGQGYEDPVPATITHVAELTLAVKGQHTKQHAWRGVYAHSLDFRSNWFQLFGHRSSDEHERPWQFCSSAVAVYPQVPNPFYLEMNTLKAQQVKLEAEVGWGSDCQSENKIRIEGVMEKSEQQLTSSSGDYETERDQQTLPWYYKQCQVDRTEGETQSAACQLAISEDSQLNVIKLEITADSVPEALQNFTYKLDLWAKQAYYANLDANPQANNPDDKLTIILTYEDLEPVELINVEVLKPTETLVYSKLYIPEYEPPSTLDSYTDVFMDQFFDDDYTPSCYVMEDKLQTFDNVTIELPDNKCQYILIHDNSPDKLVSIIGSQIDLEAKTKALSMAVAGHSIKVLPPKGESVPVVLNDKQIEVTPEKPIVLDFDKESEVQMFMQPTSSPTDSPIFNIIARQLDIAVVYDGKNIRIDLPRSFQGDQVGLCGDYNDEEFQEFTGPNGCTYVDEEDFANSYAIPGQSCSEPPKPRGPAFCPGEVLHEQKWNKQHYAKHSQESQEDEPKAPRSAQPHRKPSPQSDESEERPSRYPAPKPKRPAKPIPQQSEESEERPRPRQPKKPVKPVSSQSDESDEDDDKPTGPPSCIQEYTPSFESKQSKEICFGTQVAYKCSQGCRPVRPKTKSVPAHCIPEGGKYAQTLKEQAKHGPIQQMQNKKADKYYDILLPEKCL